MGDTGGDKERKTSRQGKSLRAQSSFSHEVRNVENTWFVRYRWSKNVTRFQGGTFGAGGGETPSGRLHRGWNDVRLGKEGD